MEKAGLPAATILTDHFRVTGESMARLWGVPDFPVIYTEHPTSNLLGDVLRQRALKLAPQVVSLVISAALPMPAKV